MGSDDAGEEVALSLASSTLVPPTATLPDAVVVTAARTLSDGTSVPATAVVRFKEVLELWARGFLSEEFDSIVPYMEYITRSTESVTLTRHYVWRYVVNADGFSTQGKQSVGTSEYKMVTALAVRLITRCNNRSYLNVGAWCYWPGDDNVNNLQVVAHAIRMEEQIRHACEAPIIDPLDPSRSVAFCNAGWAVDSKCAANFGGWGGWVSKLGMPCGRCVCKKTSMTKREIEACVRRSRRQLYAQALFDVKQYREQCHGEAGSTSACIQQLQRLSGNVLGHGLLAELVGRVKYYVTRPIALHLKLAKAVTP